MGTQILIEHSSMVHLYIKEQCHISKGLANNVTTGTPSGPAQANRKFVGGSSPSEISLDIVPQVR